MDIFNGEEGAVRRLRIETVEITHFTFYIDPADISLVNQLIEFFFRKVRNILMDNSHTIILEIWKLQGQSLADQLLNLRGATQCLGKAGVFQTTGNQTDGTAVIAMHLAPQNILRQTRIHVFQSIINIHKITHIKNERSRPQQGGSASRTADVSQRSSGHHAQVPLEDLGQDEQQNNVYQQDNEAIDNPHGSRDQINQGSTG